MTSLIETSGRRTLTVALMLAALAPAGGASASALLHAPKIDGAAAHIIRVQDACDSLWTERNAIYKAAGYCFRTQRAIARFGNAGCQHDNEADVPMSHAERQRIAAIRAAERDLGCTP